MLTVEVSTEEQTQVLTNLLWVDAEQICRLYKHRWSIKIVFRWLAEMQETGDPTTLAPEICVEVMSRSNDWEEMHDKRRLYREAGAEEVWIVTEENEIRFFAGE